MLALCYKQQGDHHDGDGLTYDSLTLPVLRIEMSSQPTLASRFWYFTFSVTPLAWCKDTIYISNCKTFVAFYSVLTDSYLNRNYSIPSLLYFMQDEKLKALRFHYDGWRMLFPACCQIGKDAGPHAVVWPTSLQYILWTKPNTAWFLPPSQWGWGLFLPCQYRWFCQYWSSRCSQWHSLHYIQRHRDATGTCGWPDRNVNGGRSNALTDESHVERSRFFSALMTGMVRDEEHNIGFRLINGNAPVAISTIIP